MEYISDHDLVQRFIFQEHGVKGQIIKLHQSTMELLEHHNYIKPVKKIMLDLASMAGLFASTLKANNEISLQIFGGNGKHTIKYAFANIKEDLSFYGSCQLIENNTYHDDLSFSDLVGADGYAVITIFPKDGQKFQGIIPLNENGIAATFEDYFEKSVQSKAYIHLFSDLNNSSACGIMLDLIANVENNDKSLDDLDMLVKTLDTQEFNECSIDKILHNLFWEYTYRVFDKTALKFKCSCSSQKCLDVIAQLSHADLEDLASKADGIEMNCHNCGRKYHFSQEQIKEIYYKQSQ